MARAASTLTVMLIPGLLLVVSDVNECEEGPAHGPCSQHANCYVNSWPAVGCFRCERV